MMKQVDPKAKKLNKENPPSKNFIVFGFIIIFGRADTGDEDATKEWKDKFGGKFKKNF